MLDLVLLHPPSVYDFRRLNIVHGPISDLIPSTPVFESYPLGFVTLAGYLQSKGYEVRIVNIANRMLRDKRFDVERFIRKLDASVFGIDLHWLPHAQGGLEIAKIVRRHHSEPVIFGGLSATYFHRELVEYPQVDAVLRGDSAEIPLERYMKAVERGKGFEDVPNLTWKARGKVKVNRLSHVPTGLDIRMDYERLIKSAIRFRDISGYVPFNDWTTYPLTAVLTCKGCAHNCVTCGGSRSAYRHICGRERLAFKKPETIGDEIESIQNYIRGPIFIIGDILQGGASYAERLLGELRKRKASNQFVFEFFAPPPRNLLEDIARSVDSFSVELSPESGDETERRNQGRQYSNRMLEDMVADCMELDCQRFDMFFMFPIPGQTRDSLMGTVHYASQLLRKHGDGRFHPFISPLAPFLDPGSLAFESPKEYGYRLFCRTLEEHRKALLLPTWKQTLNYETDLMDRGTIVESAYASACSC